MKCNSEDKKSVYGNVRVENYLHFMRRPIHLLCFTLRCWVFLMDVCNQKLFGAPHLQLKQKEITPVDLKCFKEVLATNHEPLLHSCAEAVTVTGPLGVKRYTNLIYTCLKASMLHLGTSKPEKWRKSCVLNWQEWKQ